MRMFIPDEVRNHLYAGRREKHFLRGSQTDAAIATSFVQSLNFGLGNLGASSICAAKNKGATPPAWLRDLAPILYSEGYTCTAATYRFFFIILQNNPDPQRPHPPPPQKKKKKTRKKRKKKTKKKRSAP